MNYDEICKEMVLLQEQYNKRREQQFDFIATEAAESIADLIGQDLGKEIYAEMLDIIKLAISRTIQFS